MNDQNQSPEPFPSGWQPQRRGGRGLLIFLIFLLAAGGVAYWQRRELVAVIDRLRTERVVTKTETKTVEKIVERPVEVRIKEPPEPLPAGPQLGSKKDVAQIFSGLQLKSNVLTEQGRAASKERTSADSYAVEFNVRIKVPQAATTLEDFTAINASLPVLLPALPDLLAKAGVSGFYHYLYGLKEKSIRQNILRLDRVLSRHNFYDLESVLELEHPQTKQKALLMQAEMDVVSDGSDGDRMDSFDDYIFKSQHFQPATSYGWDKLTAQPNPLVPKLEAELKEAKASLKAGDLTNAEKATLQERVADLPRIIGDLKRRSYLIAQEDPFIVIPQSFKSYRGSNAWTPDLGDCAVVICGDKVYPAIVGDYGPATKTGEASLRIAREIDSKAGPYNRPVSDLRVTYLIFPNSAEKPFRQPDYARWHQRCRDLLTKLGGDGAKLHAWEDRLKKAALEKAKAAAAKAAAAKAEAAKANAAKADAAKAATPAPATPVTSGP